MDADITRTGSRLVYENRWMRVREDSISRRDGSAGLYGVVEKPDFVVIAPVEAGLVHLVQQYRYPVEARYWELPQGTLDGKPDIEPVEAARIELAEETGLQAATLLHAGHVFPAYGYSSQGYDIFVATGLRAGAAALEREEQDLISQAFPVAAFEAMIRDGAIKDGVTIAAYGLLRLKGLL